MRRIIRQWLIGLENGIVRFETFGSIDLFSGIVDSMGRIIVEWTIACIRNIRRPKTARGFHLFRCEIGAVGGQIGERRVALISYVVRAETLTRLAILGRKIVAMRSDAVEWRVWRCVAICWSIVVRFLQFPRFVIG